MSDDLISRQAAIDIVFRSPFFFDSLTEELRALPSVQQKQTLAYWIGKELGKCSNCGHNGCSSDIWNGCLQMFCPNCGAKMEEPENDN